MAVRSVALTGSCLCLLLLASLAQATLTANSTSTLALHKNCCHNVWSRIVAAIRNLFGLKQIPILAATPANTPAPTPTPIPIPAPSTTANKSYVPNIPSRGEIDQLINRYSDYNNWAFNFQGSSDFSDYDGGNARTQHALPLCNCDCGLANQGVGGNVGRVVGGVATQKNEYPWLVRIDYREEFHCGASLINKDYILTAAHCVTGRSRRRFRIVLGDHNRLSAPSDTQVRSVSEVVRHRQYSERNMNADIALMRLNRPVSFTRNIRPICQPPTDAVFAGKTGSIVGWGTVAEGGKTSAVPLQAHLLVYSAAQCRRFKYRPSEIGNNMICAGGNSKDSCQGDSGGPLQVKNSKDKYELAGVVSWGNGCGREGYPGVYTEVAKYQSWILDNMRDTCVCVS